MFILLLFFFFFYPPMRYCGFLFSPIPRSPFGWYYLVLCFDTLGGNQSSYLFFFLKKINLFAVITLLPINPPVFFFFLFRFLLFSPCPFQAEVSESTCVHLYVHVPSMCQSLDN